MDPVIMGLVGVAGEDIGSAWSRLDEQLTNLGAHPARHWQVEDCGYIVIDDPPSWAELDQIVRDSNVHATGAARLVFDRSTGADPVPSSVVAVLPERIDHAIDLSSFPAQQIPLEKFICPTCGGMDGEHYSPPHGQ
jgi:hypothetical protein